MVTLDGRERLLSSEQSENIFSLRTVIPSLITTVFKFLHNEKELLPIAVTLEGIVTEVNPHSEKALSPMDVILLGIFAEFRLLQPKNAPSPMHVTLDGIVIEVSPLQYVNALLPMSVTLDGIVTEVISLHSQKAPCPIDFTIYSFPSTCIFDRIVIAPFALRP